MKRLTAPLLMLIAASCLFAQAKPPDATPSQDRKSAELNTQQMADLEEAKQLSARVIQLYQEDNFAEALPLAERALKLREKALGPDHALVANALSNLASLYVKKPGKPVPAPHFDNSGKMGQDKREDEEKAFALFERALKIYEHEAQPDMSRVLIVLKSLAQLYEFRLDGARGMVYMEKALRNAMGLSGGQAFGGVPAAIRKRDETIAFFQRALALKEKLLGRNHVEVARTLIKLGEIYRTDTFGDSEKAEPFYRRAAAILESQPGPLQDESSFMLGRYACFMREKKRGAEASALEARAFASSTSGEGALRQLSTDELQAQAIELPAATPALGFSGMTGPNLQLEVTVHLIANESGKVVSACALTGDVIQWPNAEMAAYLSKFKPVWVNGHPVKVAGQITYKPASK